MVAHKFNLFWNFENDSVVFLIEFFDKANSLWFGLGFGGFAMNNTDMVWFEIHDANEIYSFDGWSKGPGRPAADKSLGGTDDIELLGFRRLDGTNLIKFRRKVNTGDKYDALIERRPMNMSFAWGSSSSMNYHRMSRGKFLMYFIHTSCHESCLICKGKSFTTADFNFI